MATTSTAAASACYSGIGLYDSCLRTRWVVNRFGDLVLRTVNVCY